MKKFLALVLAGSVLSGCVSSGNPTLKNESEVSVKSKIIEGHTTKDEIRKMYGQPARTSFTDGGRDIWTYEFSDMKLDAVSYIPVVNLFKSSASGTKKELVIMFNGDRVERYSMSLSPVSTQSGLLK